MPEFILDHGSAGAAKAFRGLDLFTQGYVEAAFFTSTGTADDAEMQHATVAELAPETWARMTGDCAAFIDRVAGDLFDLVEGDSKRAGRDFWYTRNGHGCGFWDGDWPQPAATQLTELAHTFGETTLYRGDDGRIYAK